MGSPSINGRACAATSHSPREIRGNRGRPLIPGLLVVLGTGLLAAGMLSVGHFLDLPVPCGGAAGCATVAAHPSSKVSGIPIAYFGLVAYLVLLILLPRLHGSRNVLFLFVTIAGMGAAISAALLGYSHLVIRAVCAWCVVSGVAMVLSFYGGLALLKNPQTRSSIRAKLVGVVALAVALAISLQGYLLHRASEVPPLAAEKLATWLGSDLVTDAHAIGPEDAPITLIAFTDLSCSACRTAHPALRDYQAAYPKRVRLIYRHLPLWDIPGHESSGIAAAMAEIAGEEGKFWDVVHALFSRSTVFDRDGYLGLMASLGFDPTKIVERFENPGDPAIVRVQRDMALAESLGITATPTFLVLVNNSPPISANMRTLPGILSSPEITHLLQAANDE
jgi:uncharacterized membrane protein/predicted DsbA family dithiol-disulfide isomerase